MEFLEGASVSTDDLFQLCFFPAWFRLTLSQKILAWLVLVRFVTRSVPRLRSSTTSLFDLLYSTTVALVFLILFSLLFEVDSSYLKLVRLPSSIFSTRQVLQKPHARIPLTYY